MSLKNCAANHPSIFYETPHCPICEITFEKNHAIVQLVKAAEAFNLACEEIRKAIERMTCICNPQATEPSQECVVHSDNRAAIRADMLDIEPQVRKIRAKGPGSHGPYGPRCRCEGTGGGIHRKVTRWNLECPKHPKDPTAEQAAEA